MIGPKQRVRKVVGKEVFIFGVDDGSRAKI